MDDNSKRRDYRGKVRTMAQALSDTPHGGQVIIDSETFDGVKTSLPELLAAVPASPDYRELQEQAKCGRCLGRSVPACGRCPEGWVLRALKVAESQVWTGRRLLYLEACQGW